MIKILKKNIMKVKRDGIGIYKKKLIFRQREIVREQFKDIDKNIVDRAAM